MPGAEDRLLIARVAAGERDAFRGLVEAHRDAVYRFALRMTREPAAAEDVLQETFLAAYRSAASFRADGQVRSWLLSIARNAALAARRRRREEPEPDETLEALGARAGWGDEPTPEDAAAAGDRRAALERALEALGEADREVLLLRDVEGLSGEETAASLGVPLAAMKSRLHRARLRFAAALGAGGGERGARS